MERIIYRKTLDVHKSGVQFTLQGFETADNMSRKVEISLMASGDAIDFPLEQIMAVMYVNAPGASETDIVECEIKDNTVVYDVLPITKEGIAELQLKLIDIRPEGAKAVLAAPKFAIEVIKSNTDEEAATQTATFTVLEEAVAKAKAVYDARFLRMEIDSDGVFRAYYADGTVFENDSINRLLFKGDAVLARSYAKGDTGVRTAEKTDNAKYYSNVSKSAVTEVQNGLNDANAVLEEVKLHGVYTVFSVDFETGEVVYISPKYKFGVNNENGDLEIEGQAYTIDKEIRAFVDEYLLDKSFDIEDIVKKLNDRKEEIDKCNQEIEELQKEISESARQVDLDNLKNQCLKTRFGGIEYISTEDIPLDYKKYTPPEGESFVGKLSSVVDEAVYITSKSSDEDSYGELKYTLYLNNFDNTIKKKIWESSKNLDRARYAIDGKNNQLCISVYSSRTDRPRYTKVFRVEFDGALSELYTMSQYTRYGNLVICNNKLYIIQGSDVSSLVFAKIDYSDIFNPIGISLQFDNTVMEKYYAYAFIKVIGDDLYLCFPTVFYKYIDGAIKNSDITRQSFDAPHIIPVGYYYAPYDNNDIVFKSNTTWFMLSDCCWFLNDKFNLLSESLFLGKSPWSSKTYYKLAKIAADEDYLLVLESNNGVFDEQFAVLYMINCKTNECLWRCPVFDLLLRGNEYFVLNSQNFEISVCRTDGKMDTYKIIFSDEVGW